MKNWKKMCSSLVVAILFALILCTPTAFAEISNHVNLSGLSFGYSSNQQDNGWMSFSSNLSTTDLISSANVSINRDTRDPMQGWVSFNFSGVVGAPVVEADWQSSSLNLNRRGLHVDTNAGIGSYHDIVDWTYSPETGEGTPIYGDWYSTANCSVNLSNVSLIYSNGWYDEYISGGGKGVAEGVENVQDSVTRFYAGVSFSVRFTDPTAAETFCGMSPTEVTVSSVPEPATMSILGFGALALIRRRR